MKNPRYSTYHPSMKPSSNQPLFNNFIKAVKRSKSFKLTWFGVVKENGTIISKAIVRYYPAYEYDLEITVKLYPDVTNSFIFTVRNVMNFKTYWKQVPITIKWLNVRDIKSLINSKLK